MKFSKSSSTSSIAAPLSTGALPTSAAGRHGRDSRAAKRRHDLLKAALAAGMTVCGVVVANADVPAPAAPSVSAGSHTPFITVLNRNWSKWDTNNDGTLSIDEIDHVVLDPTVKGDDAAAAAALKLLSRSKKLGLPPLTKEYFAEYDRRATAAGITAPVAGAETATTDTVASQSSAGPVKRAKSITADWDLYFTASQKRMARGGGKVWPDKLVLDNMRQGPMGDCFFVATVGSMAVHRPAQIASLVKPQTNGGFEVSIPGAAPFTLGALTDSEIAISGTTTGDGVWLATMEQAYGKYREKSKGNADEEGTDSLAAGGDSGPTMSALTGHKYFRLSMARTAQEREAKEAEILPELRKHLVEALRDSRVITAGVNPPSVTEGAASQPTAGTLPKIPPDITKKHVYAVVNYDPATDMLEMWNPHGQAFTPRGAPGLANGYVTVHGRFTVPLKEAYRFYTSFTFETEEPAKGN